MRSRVTPAAWRPVGVDTLEEAADVAVRSATHALVAAGPGAGKTELLAQRACFLLETDLCPAPKRILAISFKRDAARNLQRRVELRCGEERSRRFHSLTFDAFAKGLVDRFGRALPVNWRPSPDYRINFEVERRFRDWLGAIPTSEGGLTPHELAAVNPTTYRREFVGSPLPIDLSPPQTLDAKAATAMWNALLHRAKPSVVNFHMIGRLAELVLRANPRLLRALRATYAFVFLDEFQDTTSIHYDLTKTAFLGSPAILTAVGDNKQSIMRWALALEGIFQRFNADFGGLVLRPRNNYRSAPKLVAILNHLTRALDPDAPEPVAVDDGAEGDGECRILLFRSQEQEAGHLADLIARWITTDGLRPRDICVLTRNRPADYTATLKTVLMSRHHIKARVEAELQDLLAEPVTELMLSIFQLAVRDRSPESWQRVLSYLIASTGDDTVAAAKRVSSGLQTFVSDLSKRLQEHPHTEEAVMGHLGVMTTFLGRDSLIAFHPQYGQGAFLDEQLALLARELAKELAIADWSPALDAFEGLDAVPIMTIHKSKGLEYHTVVFVGLEDGAFWGFDRARAEELSNFFVAFSRARKRVLFTFCGVRQTRPSEGPSRQFRRAITPLYDLLIQAGVQPETIDPAAS